MMHGARGSGPRASQSRGPSTTASATLDFAQVRSAAAETCMDAGTRLYAAGEAVDRVVVLGSGEVELLAHSSPGGG